MSLSSISAGCCAYGLAFGCLRYLHSDIPLTYSGFWVLALDQHWPRGALKSIPQVERRWTPEPSHLFTEPHQFRPGGGGRELGAGRSHPAEHIHSSELVATDRRLRDGPVCCSAQWPPRLDQALSVLSGRLSLMTQSSTPGLNPSTSRFTKPRRLSSAVAARLRMMSPLRSR